LFENVYARARMSLLVNNFRVLEKEREQKAM